MLQVDGTALGDGEKSLVFAEFLQRFSIPTDWRGRLYESIAAGCLFWGHVFDSDWIRDETPIYLFVDPGEFVRMPDELLCTTMGAIRNYLKKREPWAQCDTYLADPKFRSCIIITHDDECRIAGQAFTDGGDDSEQSDDDASPSAE